MDSFIININSLFSPLYDLFQWHCSSELSKMATASANIHSVLTAINNHSNFVHDLNVFIFMIFLLGSALGFCKVSYLNQCISLFSPFP